MMTVALPPRPPEPAKTVPGSLAPVPEALKPSTRPFIVVRSPHGYSRSISTDLMDVDTLAKWLFNRRTPETRVFIEIDVPAGAIDSVRDCLKQAKLVRDCGALAMSQIADRADDVKRLEDKLEARRVQFLELCHKIDDLEKRNRKLTDTIEKLDEYVDSITETLNEVES